MIFSLSHRSQPSGSFEQASFLDPVLISHSQYPVLPVFSILHSSQALCFTTALLDNGSILKTYIKTFYIHSQLNCGSDAVDDDYEMRMPINPSYHRSTDFLEEPHAKIRYQT